jgi:lipid-A-disaccharide synthase
MPQLIQQFNRIEKTILKNQPKAVIFIDYPGFNLRLAKSLRSKGYKGKLIHYVCPSVWVWGKGRIKTMAKNLDLLLTLFPFEAPLFSKTDLTVKHVGHPLGEKLLSYNYDEQWKSRVGLNNSSPILALFPGSRTQEIERTYPLQLNAAKLLLKKFPTMQLGVSLVHNRFRQQIEQLSNDVPIKLVPHHYTYELMRDARAALAKSGTVTLELAWHKTPSVILYGVSQINRLIAKYILNLDLPHYCIVNILNNRTVFPERIKEGFEPQNVANTLEPLWLDGPLRDACQDECKNAWDQLANNGPNTPSERAALAIRELFI